MLSDYFSVQPLSKLLKVKSTDELYLDSVQPLSKLLKVKSTDELYLDFDTISYYFLRCNSTKKYLTLAY
jgi:hypothetical protein